MSTHDIDILTSHFDVDGHGHMNIEAFILGMRGNLNERRLSIVEKAFAKADKTGDGRAPVEDLVECLNVKMMPEVRKGTMTPMEGAKEFIRRLEGTTKMSEGVITKGDFVDYYSWLSCSIIDDDTFVTLIETAWEVTERDVGEDRFKLCSRVMIVHSSEKVKGVTDPVKQEQYMRTTLQHFDLENDGTLTMEQFLKAAHRMSCTMDEEIGQLFFDKFAAEGGGLDYVMMARALFNVTE
jgi:Ca2+-binding EF-hand superfamily protein